MVRGYNVLFLQETRPNISLIDTIASNMVTDEKYLIQIYLVTLIPQI